MLLFPLLAGPIDQHGAVVRVTKEGVCVQAPPVAPAPPPLESRRGRWIWGSEAVPTRFRKSFELANHPRQIIAAISADVSYRLWINGALVSRGPADVGRDYDSEAPGPWFDDLRDVSRFLHKGRNVIAAEVFPTKLVSSQGTTGHPGFKLDLTEGSNNLLASDASWRFASAEDLRGHEGPNGYTVDLRKEPVGWQQPEFHDNDWQPAREVKANEAHTIPSELPPPLEAIIATVAVERESASVQPTGKKGGAVLEGPGQYAVKYPRVLSAYLAINIDGQSGAILRVMPNEADAPGYNRRAEIHLRDGWQTVELPYFDSFSVVNLELSGNTRPVTVEEVRAIFTSYPVSYRGAFSCSDPQLNSLWKVGRWVTQICMQTHHLDSPHHQEPISDAGDYMIEALNNYYAFGDATLARQDLRKIARTLRQRNFQSFHTSYSLLWLHMLMDYWDYTGDEALLHELAPDVRHLVDRFNGYVGANGLISEAPNYMFLDWVDVEGFNLHHPPAVLGQGYMTALYYQALKDEGRICERLGDAARAQDDRDRAERVRQAFNKELWDEKSHLYRDGKPFQTHVAPNQWLPADKDIETHTTQVNTLAVACGLASPETERSVVESLMGRADLHCQPYFMHFVFDALEHSGEFSRYAVPQMHRWKILPDTQSFFEMWDTGDRSHAWNATPLYQLSRRVLGVSPLTPGFVTFAVRPEPCGLSSAEGAVPTPHGDIRVRWKRSGDQLHLNVDVPPGTTALIGGNQFGPGVHQMTIPISEERVR